MITRRSFIKSVAGGSALIASGFGIRTARAQFGIPTLNPTAIPKFVTPLVIPPPMPTTSANYYEIAVRQFQQQILPPGFGPSTVWSYGSVNHSGTLNYPAFTIEAQYGTPTRVKWINDLVDGNGHYLPHLFAVDQTLHWANPPGPMPDMHTPDPTPYMGPVPIITHVHGAHTDQESDGYPEAWYLPNATNIPAGYFTKGSFYDQFQQSSSLGGLWEPGAVVFEYPNEQRATTLWYHDHSLGITRLNVYAGPAGFYILRGGPDDLPNGVLPGPAPGFGQRRSTRSPSSFRTARSTPMARCSSPTRGRISTASSGPTSPTATFRPSGTRRSSATPWWSTAAPGRS